MSIKNVFIPIIRLVKNKLFLQFISVLFIIGILFGIYLIYFSKKDMAPFYPSLRAHKEDSLEITQIKNLFVQEKYSSITTYVDNVLEILSENEKKQALFFQGESYFLLKQYNMAWKIFFIIYSDYPAFWQAPLRLAAIQIISHKDKTVGELLESIDIKSYEYYYWYGRSLIDKGKIRAGITKLKKADLSLSTTNFYIGLGYQKIGNIKDARYYLIKSLDPSFEHYKDILETLFNLAFSAKDRPNLTKYEEHLSQFYKTDKNLAERVARSYIKLGDQQKAYDVYSIFMNEANLTPRIAQILFLLAYDLKNYKDVVRFSQSFAISKEEQIKLAQAYLEVGYTRQSTVLARKLVKHPFFNEEQYLKLNRILFSSYKMLGSPDEAIKIARKIVITSQDRNVSLDLLNMYANAYYSYQKEYEQLIRVMYDENSSNIKPILESFKTNNLEKEQIEFFNYILNKDPENIQILFYKANILFKLKRMDDLKSNLLTLLALPNEKNPIIYGEAAYSLGSILLSEKNYLDSILWLNKAHILNPTPQVKLKLALAYYSSDDIVESLNLIKQIKESDNSQKLSSKEQQLFTFLDVKLSDLKSQQNISFG